MEKFLRLKIDFRIRNQKNCAKVYRKKQIYKQKELKKNQILVKLKNRLYRIINKIKNKRIINVVNHFQ